MASRVKRSMEARSCKFRTYSYKFRKGMITSAQRSSPKSAKVARKLRSMAKIARFRENAKVAQKLRSATSHFSGGTNLSTSSSFNYLRNVNIGLKYQQSGDWRPYLGSNRTTTDQTNMHVQRFVLIFSTTSLQSSQQLLGLFHCRTRTSYWIISGGFRGGGRAGSGPPFGGGPTPSLYSW